MSMNCAYGCGWNDAAGYYDCLPEPEPVDECGDITFEGVCGDNSVTWCENGTLQTEECGHGCIFDDENGYYACQ